jgi:phage tail-like protein
MSIFSQRPYCSRRFTVDLGIGDATPFAEVILPDLIIDVVEYRDGSSSSPFAEKLPGRPKFGNIILKRNYRGSLELYEWWKETSLGNANSRRNITISLLSDDGTNVVTAWKIRNAFPIKLEGPHLNAKGNEVAIETLELACESIEIE